jgi:hypothetical protein
LPMSNGRGTTSRWTGASSPDLRETGPMERSILQARSRRGRSRLITKTLTSLFLRSGRA